MTLRRIRAVRTDKEPPSPRTRSCRSAIPTATNRALARAVQAKLELGPVGDRYEQEADAVARTVVSSLGASGAQRQGVEDEELLANRLQRRELEDERNSFSPAPRLGAAGGPLEPATEGAIDRARSGGQPLQGQLRRGMEAAFGADFSNVRVHTGPDIDSLNRSMQARAFTTGSDVFVRRRDSSLASRSGRHLIAHELAHVIQQGGARMTGRHDPLTRPGLTPTEHARSALPLQRYPVRFRLTTGVEHPAGQVDFDFDTSDLDHAKAQLTVMITNYRVNSTGIAWIRQMIKNSPGPTGSVAEFQEKVKLLKWFDAKYNVNWVSGFPESKPEVAGN